MVALTAGQMLALCVSERAMSALSLIGSFFIIFTFLRWPYFRKPINRLIFLATFGNVLTSTATSIATSALPHGDGLTSLCEFQGIVIQWFMMADSLWVFAMALNVMLVFFRGFNSRQLRKLEMWYFLCCYGLPGIPAITYLIMDHTRQDPIIGSATIWCWVSKKSEWMRIAFFYGPVWIVISCTLTIYIAAGRKIFQKRSILRSFSRNAAQEAQPSRTSFSSTIGLSNPVLTPPPQSSSSRFSRVNWAGANLTIPGATNSQDENARTYQVSVTAAPSVSDIEIGRSRPVSYGRAPATPRRLARDGNTAAWGYFKVAFLMFAALFIVWVPSTINRLQQFAQKGQPIFGLNLASALVLPLQGFWNAMVYISTTWPEIKRAHAEVRSWFSRHEGNRQSDSHRRSSEHTLSQSVDLEFEPDADISLTEMIQQGPPVHSRDSSNEKLSL
ncbi:hypothetical protein EJ04DRAFT_492119 [Polyplosphaeria fusca]|uniref:G-protein coupled receptors family 2 profile 2 domain-containing protein n=1 Tax=Polyplosphaeria fusca TaxID=682080 RepID=A0A9P4QZ32_9PLEO|nr:hypothetical protein EJ04DRAFT_492119 [Polyplosphaeria fusca]